MSGFQAWIRSHGCVVEGCGERTIHVHHVRSRGAGGIDEGNLVPLCVNHHVAGPKAIHTIGRKTWEAYHGIDLAAAAAELWSEWNEG